MDLLSPKQQHWEVAKCVSVWCELDANVTALLLMFPVYQWSEFVVQWRAWHGSHLFTFVIVKSSARGESKTEGQE